MYPKLRRSKQLGLFRSIHTDLQLGLQVLDSVVFAVLLYRDAIWGHENDGIKNLTLRSLMRIIEKLNLIVCRILLSVHISTAQCMISGDLDRYPLQIYLQNRTLNYRDRINGKGKQLTKLYIR